MYFVETTGGLVRELRERLDRSWNAPKKAKSLPAVLGNVDFCLVIYIGKNAEIEHFAKPG